MMTLKMPSRGGNGSTSSMPFPALAHTDEIIPSSIPLLAQEVATGATRINIHETVTGREDTAATETQDRRSPASPKIARAAPNLLHEIVIEDEALVDLESAVEPFFVFYCLQTAHSFAALVVLEGRQVKTERLPRMVCPEFLARTAWTAFVSLQILRTARRVRPALVVNQGRSENQVFSHTATHQSILRSTWASGHSW